MNFAWALLTVMVRGNHRAHGSALVALAAVSLAQAAIGLRRMYTKYFRWSRVPPIVMHFLLGTVGMMAAWSATKMTRRLNAILTERGVDVQAAEAAAKRQFARERQTAIITEVEPSRSAPKPA